ncbi:MAG: DNA primase [Desulfurococcales archaeon]|nr:DNA primase [Desulfurococcales archaeon]
MKYLIKAKFEVDGRVDRHDVIGAIFGQTEGLLGTGYSLEELQDRDKIGRVHVDLKYQGSKTVGTIQIPSNLDRVETSIIAAMLETVDRVGPYTARITVEEIKDLRVEKLKKIVERAKELLSMMKEKEPDIKEIVREILKEERPEPVHAQITEYGPEKLPAGPDVEKADTIILVEGRADVINLLKYGYTNVIAVGGAREKVPKTIVDLSKKKKVVAFVDGDRGGELILKTLLAEADVDYVARAPEGMEVEDLTGREIAKALSEAVPAEEYKRKLGLLPEEVEEVKPEAKREEAVTLVIPKEVLDEIPKLKGTLEAVIYDSEWKPIERLKVRDLFNRLQEADPGKIHAVVFDGIITQRLLDLAAEKGIELIIGARVGSKLTGKPSTVKFLTFSDLT